MPHQNEVVAQLFVDQDFKGFAHWIQFKTTEPYAVPPNQMMDLSGEPRIYKKASSLKYDCPPGVELIFGENTSYEGTETRAFWGMGQEKNLKNMNYGDRIKCWMWRWAEH